MPPETRSPVRIGIDARKLSDFGIGTYLRNLLPALDRLGGGERYVLFVYPDADPPRLGPRFTLHRVRARGYSLREHLELPLAASAERIDLYHAPHYVIPWLLPCPAVVTVHDLIHLRYPRHLGLRVLAARVLLERSLQLATRVMTVSETSRRDLVSMLGASPERVRVVPNAVEPLFLAPLQQERVVRLATRLELQHTSFVLYAGNIKPHKNLPRLLRAFSRVRERHPDLLLVLAGCEPGSPEVRGIEALARELGVASRLRLPGFLELDELAALYSLARVVALPSLWEGFGLPLLEAMAVGTPVLTGDVPPLREVASDAALLVDPLSVDAIASGLELLLGDQELRRELRARGARRARDWGWNEAARAVLETYREALSGA